MFVLSFSFRVFKLLPAFKKTSEPHKWFTVLTRSKDEIKKEQQLKKESGGGWGRGGRVVWSLWAYDLEWWEEGGEGGVNESNAHPQP